RHWPAYEQKFGARLLPSHRHAVAAIVSCRTPALGGHLFECDCGLLHYAYHSCNHRACPQCGYADATDWLERQRRRLLPLPYYLVTFTVPKQLRALIRSHQKLLYDLLLRHSAAALLTSGATTKIWVPKWVCWPCFRLGRATCAFIPTSIASCPPAASPPTACAGFVPKTLPTSCPRQPWRCACAHSSSRLCSRTIPISSSTSSTESGPWIGWPMSKPSAGASRL